MIWGKSSHNLPLFTAWNDGNNVSKWMFQRHRCCAFDSPGLPNDSAGYPGLRYSVRGTTPSVLRFFWLIRHESPCYNHVFKEKAQHLQRWIPLRMLTRGRLIPRQPRAIKSTTPTALHRCVIRNGGYIRWNIGIKLMALHGENIHHGKCNHWNAGIKSTALHHEGICIAKFFHWNNGAIPTALCGYNIHHGGYIHWNIGTFYYLFVRILALIVLQNARINTIGVALLIAQGCQTIVQATLGWGIVCVEQRHRCCAFFD